MASPDSWVWRDSSAEDRAAYDLAGRADLSEFITARNDKVIDQVHNLACRRILGEPQGGRSELVFARLAFECLCEEALWFGLQEEFAWSALHLPLLFRLKKSALDAGQLRQNVTTQKRVQIMGDGDLPEGVLGADLILYEKAQTLFQRRVHSMMSHIYAALVSP